MSDQNNNDTVPGPIKTQLDQTQPNQISHTTETVPVPVQPQELPLKSSEEFDQVTDEKENGQRTTRLKDAFLRVLVIFIGLVALILAGAGGGWLGYQAAVKDRMAKESENLLSVATEQFLLALQDQAEGRLDVAKRRLEYVIQLDPNFPGAMQKLTEVMISAALTATPNTPTPAPTITSTPTPDTRGIEEKFNQAQQFYAKKEWANLIGAIDNLRKTDLNYRTVEVDGMYYVALRFRGVDKILKEGNLEGGIFDLVMVERFGPLDTEANGFRNWARLYLTGSSYWEINWEQVVYYFGQIAPALPNLKDGAGMTASERYRIGSIRYGDKLVQEGDHCAASKQYRNALNLFPDPKLIPVATEVAYICNPPPTPTLKSTSPPVSTPTLTNTPKGNGAPTVVTTQPPVPPTQVSPTLTPTPLPPTATPQPPTATKATP